MCVCVCVSVCLLVWWVGGGNGGRIEGVEELKGKGRDRGERQ